jgi:hypothetical protein
MGCLAGVRDFTLLTSVQAGCGPLSLLCNVYVGRLHWGITEPGSEADHSPPSSDEVKYSGVIPSSPFTASWRCSLLIKDRENTNSDNQGPTHLLRGTRFIAVFTNAQWPLMWVRWIQYTSSHSWVNVVFNIILAFTHWSSKWSLILRFPTEILHAWLTSHMHST